MKKTAIGMAAVVAGLAMLNLSATPAVAAERPGFETYVVRSGDTLSKISGRIFGDVKRWREILKENPQVTNANRIFPGDILQVPMPEKAAPAVADVTPAPLQAEIAVAPAAPSEQAAVATGAAADTTPAPEPPATPKRQGAVISQTLYRSAGYIADKIPALAIIATEDDRMVLGSDDVAIVNASLTPGTRLTVVRANRRIFHPVTGAYLGWLIRILGTGEVSCRGERTSSVVLRGMMDSASVGDYLVPFDPNDVLEKNALAEKAQAGCIPAGACDAVIVAFNEERQAVGEQEFAYLDKGTESGVAPGQRFTIYREGSHDSRVTVGELQVLRAGAHTSTGLITTSDREAQVGNLLRAR